MANADRRQSRWRDPESASRFGVLLGSWAVLAVLTAVGVLTAMDALGWATFAVLLFVFWQYSVEKRARRDLTADLAAQIHDERVTGKDLRRSRGLWQVEDQLSRARKQSED